MWGFGPWSPGWTSGQGLLATDRGYDCPQDRQHHDVDHRRHHQQGQQLLRHRHIIKLNMSPPGR